MPLHPRDRLREWAIRLSPPGTIDPFAIRWTTSTFVAIVVGVAAAVLAVAALGRSATPPGADPWSDPQAAPPLTGQESQEPVIPISPIAPLPSDDPYNPGNPTRGGAPGRGPAHGGLVPVGDASSIPVPGPAAPGTIPTPSSAPAPARKEPTTPPPPPDGSAYHTIQGETFDGQNGVRTEPNEKGGGVHIGFISNGDFVRYDNVGFTDVPATSMVLGASNAARQNRTGRVELRLDSRSSAPIGTMTIPNNGDWFAFSTYQMSITPTTGTHTIFLTFTSGQDEEFANVDWLSFRR